MSQRASARVKIVNRLGLHARPAMALVDVASEFSSRVTIRRGDASVDGKSIMEVLMLAATKGTELEIEAEGGDAREAVEAIRGLIERGFDED